SPPAPPAELRQQSRRELPVNEHRDALSWVSHFLHRHFLWFVLASYAVASCSPGLGLWIRGVSFGDVAFLGQKTTITLPVLMLAFLLFNAGLGVQTGRLHNLAHRPILLLAGLAANLAIPLAFILVVWQVMGLWHNPDEVQNILVGLAL